MLSGHASPNNEPWLLLDEVVNQRAKLDGFRPGAEDEEDSRHPSSAPLGLAASV